MTDLDALDPVLVHHIVNSMGWADLRPLQHAAISPLSAGDDALLLAPTAGGKTEAALFPLLSRLAGQRSPGIALLYLCPLKALLNNLLPRVEMYASWLGLRAAVWHGDVSSPARRAILAEPPSILLTTPESLESMLVSVNVDHRSVFADLRTVVVDEVHAFAGDDRGWHLLAILERLTHLLDRPLQRVGLSATVGNPDDLLGWLQGSSAGRRPAHVVAPETVTAGSVRDAEIELDYVGSLENAATVIAALHAGEKRLVFCESRTVVERLGQQLRARGVTTFLSHASLSVDERRRAEVAFAEARDCVIVSTSTLELGIDVGDLDRVIQIECPSLVASFLQRIGRTGRRPGAVRNTLFLTTSEAGLVRAAGLLYLWGKGWVEPIVAPPEPRHIVAQQLLALCLQEGRIGNRTAAEWWNGLAPFTGSLDVVQRYLMENGYLDHDNGMMFVGPSAELRFGRRHFSDMTAVFAGAPEFTVLAGRNELGRIDPSLLVERVEGPRRLLLAGRSWTVTHIDWSHRRCFVEQADSGGRARWLGLGWGGTSFALTRAMRDVLLGADPPVRLTRRATAALKTERADRADYVDPSATVVYRDEAGRARWWTWAGFRANATLVSTLGDMVDGTRQFDDHQIRLRDDLTPQLWTAAIADAAEMIVLPEPAERALVGLKFSDALPKHLAMTTLAARLGDVDGALTAVQEQARFVTHG